jgi:hypothetical protein
MVPQLEAFLVRSLGGLSGVWCAVHDGENRVWKTPGSNETWHHKLLIIQ